MKSKLIALMEESMVINPELDCDHYKLADIDNLECKCNFMLKNEISHCLQKLFISLKDSIVSEAKREKS